MIIFNKVDQFVFCVAYIVRSIEKIFWQKTRRAIIRVFVEDAYFIKPCHPYFLFIYFLRQFEPLWKNYFAMRYTYVACFYISLSAHKIIILCIIVSSSVASRLLSHCYNVTNTIFDLKQRFDYVGQRSNIKVHES